MLLEAADKLAYLCELLLAAYPVHQVSHGACNKVYKDKLASVNPPLTLDVVRYHVVSLLLLLIKFHLAPQVFRVFIAYK